MPDRSLEGYLTPGTDPDVAAAYARLGERAREAVFGFEDEVAVVDVETTGFDPSRDGLIEVAAAVARGPEVLARYRSHVDPGAPLSAETVKLTGITDADLEGAPPADEVAGELRRFVGERDLLAHNASFDRTFVESAGGPLPGRWLDSLQLARIALPRLRTHRLVDLAAAFGVPLPSHRAADDVEALCAVYRILRCALDDLPDGLPARIAALSPSTAWPLRGPLAHHAAARPSPPADTARMRRDRLGPAPRDQMLCADDVPCAGTDPARVAHAFSPQGVAGRMYPGFERRDEQERMAAAVAEAFGQGFHLAVEAGTGVGKSIAYLLPAAVFALENHVGVGVATKTNALTDQLVHRELPALAAALRESSGEPLRFVLLKGYEHYVCLRKLDRFAAEADGLDEESLSVLAATLSWTAQSSWGDLDSLNVHWPRELRGRIAASPADCTHRRCRFHPDACYVHGARRRAACAHIVVTNHALLFRDAVCGGGILPPVRYWVVDEAHGAEAEARKQLSLEASHAELKAVLGSLHTKGRGGVLDPVRRSLTDASGAQAPALRASIEDMRRSAEAASTTTDSLFDLVKDLGEIVPGRGYETVELRVTPALRETGGWGTVAGVAAALARRLEALIERGRSMVTALESLGETAGGADVRANLAGLLVRLAEQREALVAVVDGEDSDLVYALSLDRRRDVHTERLSALRLDVGEALASTFHPVMRSVVYCSATIAAGDDFSHFARSVGLDRLTDGAWRHLRLASSYDFERQMRVFVPTDVSSPQEAAYLEDMERLLDGVHRAMGGSVLTLFTNRRDMEALYERLEPTLDAAGIPLLVQGRGASTKRIQDEFLADERLSLFATKSFWEGFDAKGDTLRCVIVPKLPFGQLGDPLLEERRERDRDWWERWYLPEAIIELEQAAGRLIRSSTDTGCLVIADTRVLGARAYGRRFLEALPVREVDRLPLHEMCDAMAELFGAEGRGR